MDRITVTPVGRMWAVTHNDGFLGYAKTRDDAAGLAEHLADWLSQHGRVAEFVVQDQIALAASSGTGVRRPS